MQVLNNDLYSSKPKNFLREKKQPLVLEKEDYTYVSARVNDWEVE